MPSSIEVKAIEPAALSPKDTAAYLSLSRRAVSILIADTVLIARKAGSRTLVDFQSVKAFYNSLPVVTVSASIPNSPQVRYGRGHHRARRR